MPLMGVLQGLAREVTRTVLPSREAPAVTLCHAPAKAPVTYPCGGCHRSAALTLRPLNTAMGRELYGVRKGSTRPQHRLGKPGTYLKASRVGLVPTVFVPHWT